MAPQRIKIKKPIVFNTDYPHLYILTETQINTWNNWLLHIHNGIKTLAFMLLIIMFYLLIKTI